MRLRYTLPAVADLESILEYIGERSPQGAKRVRARIKEATQLLLKHPHIGVRTADPVIRRTMAYPYPYLIFYEAGGREILVHAIRHGARDPESMPDA